MGALELTPHKASRAPFPGPPGQAGIIMRNICLENGLIMRAVGDRMIISPPLVIRKDELNEMVGIIQKCLDKTKVELIKKGLLQG